MEYRNTINERFSTTSGHERDVPSFIEPRPPLILNPFMRPKPQKGTNLMELFDEDYIDEEVPELVQVYLRMKPSNVRSNLYEVRSDQCLITSVDTATAGHGRRTQHNVSKMYSFSHIFGPDANQKEIFEHVVKDNLRKLPDGHSFTLLTYGASGSGKTYTLMGTVKAPGLVPRSLEYVFKLVDAAQTPVYRPGESKAVRLNSAEQAYELQWVHQLRHVSEPLRDKYRRMSTRLCGDLAKSTLDLSNKTKHYVWVSFVEIYNEAIYDLLVTTDRTAASKLRIREDPSGNVYVKGATQAFVRTGEEAYDVMVAGKHNLQVHATGVHAHSSRSHCIFTITMLTETENGVRSSYVRLCDLAGSERARRTRNTGARMAESRAINASLHVLERCLHTLRRKRLHARDLVPYRESKLTRLLGAGLSGTRGEAVSMVVTVNPSPEYAHETKHVLQLAAVARDIQVNNTIAETTLDSSCSRDASIISNAETIRLRTDNERLHYELIQVQSMNRKLMSEMEQQQEQNAGTIKELVEEAREITEQYYNEQIHNLQKRHEAEIQELREEYEAKLSQEVKPKITTECEGTPSRSLQNKVILLTQQIAILMEELQTERLARARMEEEMAHLRACIEERDEKSEDKDSEDAIDVSDEEASEDDSEEADDLCNDSLEPTFKKEDINRSRLIRQSSLFNSTHNTTTDMNKTRETAKDDSLTDVPHDSTMTDHNDTHERLNRTDDASMNDSNNQSMNCPVTVKKADVKNSSASSNVGRGTYFVDSNVVKKLSRETYFVDSKVSINVVDNVEIKNEVHDSVAIESDAIKDEIAETKDDVKDIIVEKPLKYIDTHIDKMKKHARTTVSSNTSLTQFELLEKEMKDFENEEKAQLKYFGDATDIVSPRNVKEKKTYFDNIDPSPKKDNVIDLVKKQDILRSPSIVVDEIPEDYKPSTINKLIRESFNKSAEPSAYNKSKILLRNYDSIDMFEEMDSPCMKNGIPKNVEDVRKTIENLAVGDKKSSPVDDASKDSAINIDMENSDIQNRDGNLKTKPTNESNDIKLDERTDTNPVKITVKREQLSDEDNEMENQKSSEMKQDNHQLIDKHGENAVDIEITNSVNANQEQKISNIEIDIQEKNKVKELPSNSTVLKDVKIEHMFDENNTIDAFEDIYKNLTMSRATEFDLLVSETSHNIVNEISNENNIVNSVSGKDETKETDTEKPMKKSIEKIEIVTNNKSQCKTDEANPKKETGEVPTENNKKTEERENTDAAAIKYNLRHKTHVTENDIEVLVENTAKCASRTVKKSLRLRRNKTKTEVDEDDKLKDIGNLQKEFSDVTLDVPAPVKHVQDIPSPEKSEGENLPPIEGIQSCPSKSVTRSRRKLFTPRPEPLDESPTHVGDSNERIRVPRPSYHRTRTRRRLN